MASAKRLQQDGVLEVFQLTQQASSKAGTACQMSALEKDAVCLSWLMCVPKEQWRQRSQHLASTTQSDISLHLNSAQACDL